MKKPFILAFLAIGLAFTSCSKDDDNEEISESTLEGTWMLVSGLTDGDDDMLSDCEKTSFYKFNDDKTYSEEYNFGQTGQCNSDKFSGTYEILSNNKLKLSASENDNTPIRSFTYTYSLSNNMITIIYPKEDGEEEETSDTYQKQ